MIWTSKNMILSNHKGGALHCLLLSPWGFDIDAIIKKIFILCFAFLLFVKTFLERTLNIPARKRTLPQVCSRKNFEHERIKPAQLTLDKKFKQAG